MHVKIIPQLLKEAVAKLKSITKIPSLDIKFMVYCLKASKDGNLSIITSDLDSVSMKVTVKANVIEEGCININGTNFQRVVNKLDSKKSNSSGIIELKLEGLSLMLNTKTIYEDQEIINTRDFSLVDVDMSRDVDELAMHKPIKISATVFKEMLLTACNIVNSKNVDYAELSGISLNLSNDGKLTIAGCDGPRLIESSTIIDQKGKEIAVILPKLLCNIIHTAINVEDETLNMAFSDRYSRFELHKNGMSVVITCSLLYGDYPEFTEFFNIDGVKIKINQAVLLDCIDNIVDVLADDSFKIKITFNKDKLNIAGASSSTSKIRNDGIKITPTVEEPIEIAVNAYDLKTVLFLMKSSEVDLVIKNAESPIIIKESISGVYSNKGLISTTS